MHAKPDLRVFLKWMIAGSGSAITDVIPLNHMALKLLAPFVVRPNPDGRFKHIQGGSPIHESSLCPHCNRSLQLVWNLDCSDTRFRTSLGRPLFKGIDRLALYWCFPCFTPLQYRIIDNSSLGDFSTDPNFTPEPKPPYKNFPAEFEELEISLTGISELPTTVQKLLTSKSPPKLTDNRRKLLERHVGHSVSERTFELLGTWIHQFGGAPYLAQGDEWITCRNPACKSSGKRMKFLAAVRNDPPNGLPFVETLEKVSPDGHFNSFVAVYFHYCKSCSTISCHNQST